MSYKFIFDASALNNASIEKFRKARLIEACKDRAVCFYVTPVLLREKLDFVVKNEYSNNANKNLRFLLDLSWAGLFTEPRNIFLKELTGDSYMYGSTDEMQTIRENLTVILKGAKSDDNLSKRFQIDKEQWQNRKTHERSKQMSLRTYTNNILKGNKKVIREKSKFPVFLKNNIELTAINIIKKNLTDDAQAQNGMIAIWNSDSDKCRYFNKFVELYLYISWYTIASVNDPKKDVNALDDIEHLIYLNDVDGIISNETGFMKSAHKEVFPNKEYLSVDEFVERIKNG